MLDPGRCRRCRGILEADGKKPSPPGTTDPLATVGAALSDALAREYDPAEMADFVKFALEQEGFGTETLARAMEKTPGDPPGRCLGEPVADVEVVHLRYEITLSAAVNLKTGRVEELIRLNHEQGERGPWRLSTTGAARWRRRWPRERSRSPTKTRTGSRGNECTETSSEEVRIPRHRLAPAARASTPQGVSRAFAR